MSDNVSSLFHGPVTLWIKLKGLVSCFWKKEKTVYDIIIGRTHVWCFHLFHGPVTLWIKFKGLVSCCLWYNYWKDACLIMFPFVSRPRNFMNKVQRACIMFLKETKPFIWYNYWKDACLIMFHLFHGPVTLWIKFKGLVSCFWKKQNRLWYNYWKDACLIMFPFVSRPRNFILIILTCWIIFMQVTCVSENH